MSEQSNGIPVSEQAEQAKPEQAAQNLDDCQDGHFIHVYNGIEIKQRTDGYMDATAMCKANGKQWGDYERLKSTDELRSEISSKTGIPVLDLVESRKGGDVSKAGTWVHPLIAYNLAQWCSARFAVQVSIWLHILNTTGKVEIDKPIESPASAITPELTALISQMVSATIATALQAMLPRRAAALIDARAWILKTWLDINSTTLQNILGRMDSLHRVRTGAAPPKGGLDRNSRRMIDPENMDCLLDAFNFYFRRATRASRRDLPFDGDW